jgi:protein TonB
MRKESLAVSLALHVAVLGSLLLLRIPQQYANPKLLPRPRTFEITKLTAPPSLVRRSAAQAAAAGRSGGGVRSPIPPAKGVPPRVEARIFVPPQNERPEQAKLVVPMGIEDVPKLAPGPMGDPLGKTNGLFPFGGLGTSGSGGDGDKGIGRGPGGKNGDGGPGYASALVRKPSKWPEVLYKAEPEYSDYARKAHHQGSVLLAVEVGVDGLPRNIRVIRGIGMGLDEKAMDAVATWRFRPALANGRPVAAPITVEVNFRLL